jgi:Lar family restriction alleviation protein
MENELKPCPFCGGEAHIVTYLGKKRIVYIECDGCKVLMGNPKIMTSALKGKLYFEDENKLIKAWNNRK